MLRLQNTGDQPLAFTFCPGRVRWTCGVFEAIPAPAPGSPETTRQIPAKVGSPDFQVPAKSPFGSRKDVTAGQRFVPDDSISLTAPRDPAPALADEVRVRLAPGESVDFPFPPLGLGGDPAAAPPAAAWVAVPEPAPGRSLGLRFYWQVNPPFYQGTGLEPQPDDVSGILSGSLSIPWSPPAAGK